ncbi:DUF1049 domain-containing protein [Amycolatopsis sp. K13G38]|uniref:DUF1049 domain-containing protein n=1 Tax=Amycolatopsis acididurans TaxID=2724524 RepID=A0ABX1J730_9PSEU|nr:lipopolysaccharide assembly protein LapA domain-containing protein [Amycolatopsis acididurans]NKQ55106.1 DUF1049 domain-containing protein [Amycolatopsis acididurans]
MTHAQDGDSTEVPREPATPTAPPRPAPIKRTRISGTWLAVIVALVVLIFLLIFILQNLDSVNVDFLGMSGSLPLAVAMLFSAIGGAILVALVGGARIAQLRRATRKANKALR